jgi:hypothetical protein
MDRRLGIVTAAPNYLEDRDYNALHNRYEPIRYRVLKRLLPVLGLTATDVLIDVGCGLGRAVCFFAQQAVGRCIGIEFNPKLAHGAMLNAQRMYNRRSEIDIILIDATCYDYSEATILFLYNPFNAIIMETFITRVVTATSTSDRTRLIVYANPVHSDVFASFQELELLSRFLTPRLGVPDWFPIDLGGTTVEIWKCG